MCYNVDNTKDKRIERMQHEYNDGGREKAGFKGETGDCVVRAIAIACELDYKEVYKEIKRRQSKGKSPRHGVARKIYEPFLKEHGYEWIATMRPGTGCQVHMKSEELPNGRIITRLSRHLCCVVDGVIHDTYDPSRNGKRCVYGYFYKKDV